LMDDQQWVPYQDLWHLRIRDEEFRGLDIRQPGARALTERRAGSRTRFTKIISTSGAVAFLGLKERVFHSVVFFIGESEFKTPMPPNITVSGLSTYIRSFRTRVFTRLRLSFPL
jgi:hypothetical protein